ncbi:GNAT family N-acetyltransferase [Thalassospiraceae bacterium LMO-SO8]|nr:GNAT family N-acetyltransferase [Alphaproteobacteria bacterium LMO-S08]WND74798.1 GNAT family N-acetyltransferase [Thalassospiraceae bacterium LMO-SO8]
MKTDTTTRWMTADRAEDDAPRLLTLMRDLAVFEGWPELLSITAAEIASRIRATPPALRAVLAEAPAGSPVGFATVFEIPYAYAARPSLELEMLYVMEPWRAQGVGRALMDAVLAHARETDCERVEWNVLADNARAQAFYKSLGAAEKAGWRRWGLAV